MGHVKEGVCVHGGCVCAHEGVGVCWVGGGCTQREECVCMEGGVCIVRCVHGGRGLHSGVCA